MFVLSTTCSEGRGLIHLRWQRACETCMVYLVEAAKGLSVKAAEMEGGLFVPTEVNGANLSDIVVFL